MLDSVLVGENLLNGFGIHGEINCLALGLRLGGT